MKWIPYVLYEFTRNQIYTITMKAEHNYGDYLMITCAYTGDEHHYIFLGDL